MSWLGYSRSLLHLFINSMALAVFFFSACCNSVLDVEADEQSVLAKISQDEDFLQSVLQALGLEGLMGN